MIFKTKLPVFIILPFFLYFLSGVSAQIPCSTGAVPYRGSNDDASMLLALILLATKGRNENCGNCGCNQPQIIPIPYPIPFPVTTGINRSTGGSKGGRTNSDSTFVLSSNNNVVDSE